MADASVEEEAEIGNIEAQCSLAFLFEIGLDRPQDYRQAAHYWQMAAREGSQLATEKLQLLLKEGKIQASWLDSNLPPTKSRPDVNRLPASMEPKILIADDEAEIRMIVAEALEMGGYRVLQAANGEEALQKIIANPDIKLILTDLKMSKLNGLQLIKTLRRMQVAETARIVIMTAFTQPSFIAEGKKLNVDAWLVKPVPQEVMLDTIKRLMERKPQVDKSL